MAQMYPKCIEGLYELESREGDVFDALRQLPEDWMVFHSMREIIGGNYEADFVIMVPHRGYIILEVKNGYFDIEDGIWWFWNRESKREMFPPAKRNPLHQAALAASKFHRNRLAQKHLASNKDAEFTSAALLLRHSEDDADFVAALGTDREHYILGDAILADPEALAARLLACFKFREQPQFTPEVMQRIRDDIAPSYFFRRMSHEDYAHSMDNASANVSELFAMLRHSRADVRVEGCAGSGKTVMLVNEAKRLTEEARAAGTLLRILVLCFNRNLKSYLEHQLRGYGDMVRVENFNSLLWWIADSAGIPRDDMNLNRLPSKAELQAVEAVLRADANGPYSFHHVFIDEAQDMKAAWWQRILTQLTRGQLPDGRPARLYIFSDSNQALYQDKTAAAGEEGESLCSIPECPIHISLTRNLRNSWQIARYGANLLNELPPDQRPQAMEELRGPDVCISPGSDNVEERRAEVNRIIAEILSDKVNNVSKRDIVILSPYRPNPEAPEKSALSQYLLPGGNAMATDSANATWDGVAAMTIKSFKGLESLFVILVDIGPIGSSRALTRNDFYVACTRAKYGLYIVPTVAGEAAAREFMSTAP